MFLNAKTLLLLTVDKDPGTLYEMDGQSRIYYFPPWLICSQERERLIIPTQEMYRALAPVSEVELLEGLDELAPG